MDRLPKKSLIFDKNSLLKIYLTNLSCSTRLCDADHNNKKLNDIAQIILKIRPFCTISYKETVRYFS